MKPKFTSNTHLNDVVQTYSSQASSLFSRQGCCRISYSSQPSLSHQETAFFFSASPFGLHLIYSHCKFSNTFLCIHGLFHTFSVPSLCRPPTILHHPPSFSFFPESLAIAFTCQWSSLHLWNSYKLLPLRTCHLALWSCPSLLHQLWPLQSVFLVLPNPLSV